MVLFVTGRLAEPALRRVLAEMAPPFAWDVAVLEITVAALMTTSWIARHLEAPPGTERVLIPGLSEGDPQAIADRIGVPVEKGPKDLREIPQHFGRAEAARAYGEWDIEILAEINNAPKLSREAIRSEADYFRACGADLIDIGCTPGLAFPALGDVVRDLVAAGMRVSIDTFDAAEIRTAVDAGAELVLSVNGSNSDAARQLAGTGARVVAVPDLGGSLDTLDPTLEKLARWGIPYLIDPIVEPIGFGFMASLERYAEVRRRYPDAGMLMGVGNITELTSADSTGVNALLVAVCQELGIRSVLTTEVIPWARGAVREIDVARRLMHYAVTRRTIPKGIDDRLVTVKDPAPLTYTQAELRALQKEITDPNFRIFADRDGITVFNNEQFVRGSNIQDIFDQLDVDEPAHAFYLGKELARASLAVTLGKTYRQEGALQWGYLTPPDDARREHVRLTHKPRA
ncbi:MAG: dihydropteroate synthase [Acidimicrobiia bacterium]|nr:dihydropteroate synthase [Acidimicrobiia bacterium]